MAGDWIKMRVNLDTDPAVVRMASALQQDRYSIVGRLHRIWSWANEHLTDGQDVPVDAAFLDDLVGTQGFAAAMRNAGWLSGRDNSLAFPHFERHNLQSAKTRALDAIRKQQKREAEKSEACPDDVQEKSALEKRREEKSNNKPPPPSISAPSAEAELVAVVDSLNSLGIVKTSCVNVASEAGCSPEHIRGLIEHYERHWREIGWSSGALVHRIAHARPGMAIAEGWVPGKQPAEPPTEDWSPAPDVECPNCHKSHRGNKRRKQLLQCVRCVANFELNEVVS